jgi:hypothetical protein
MTQTEGLDEVFKEETGEDAKPHIILQGGNVLNSMWSIGLKHFRSTVFIAVGNDLSYELKDDIEDQRTAYYADGDYSSNAKETGTGRDEAKTNKRWMGFKLIPKKVYTGKFHDSYDVELGPVGTSHTLWVYKTWLEANVLANENKGIPYHYYNSTEGGIAGVMCKDDSDEGLVKIDNWFLMDDICKRWHTSTLADAAKQFIKAKEIMKCKTGLVAPSVISTVHQNSGGIANSMPESTIIVPGTI